eukprot:1922725-Prymnesium_polylepis.1
MPGVDFDQTHCTTMRASSLRVLCAVGAGLGLRMRRWHAGTSRRRTSRAPCSTARLCTARRLQATPTPISAPQQRALPPTGMRVDG